MYSSTKELKIELNQLKETKIFSQRLIDIIEAMTSGIYKRYIVNNNFVLYEDYNQNCWMLFMKRYKQADLNKNLFAWFSTIFLNQLRQEHRKSGIMIEFTDDLEIFLKESQSKNHLLLIQS